MKELIKQTLIFTVLTLVLSSLPAYSSSTERYDLVLARLERQKENLKKQHKVVSPEGIEEQELIVPKAEYTLGFDHRELPDLEGWWLVTKTTLKRKINPILKQRITFIHSNHRVPIAKRDFIKKLVYVSSRGPDFFAVRAVQPYTYDSYVDPIERKDIIYENFSFKAVIDPFDLSYAYTQKVKDHLENLNLSRQVWLKGHLKYEFISSERIVAKGWEEVYTPEFDGFILDEVRFELIRGRHPEGAAEPKYDKLPFEQEVIAKEIPLIPIEDKSGYEPALFYKPIDTTLTPPKEPIKVPGLW